MTSHVIPAAARARLDQLRPVNLAFNARHPGEAPGRQPVHTVYGGGHLFRADTAARLGAVAREALAEYAPDAQALGECVGLTTQGDAIHARVREKLEREPVEDFRIDFEDGYGNRPDDEEDGHVAAAAREVALGLDAGTLPPFIGIRIKPLNEELRDRSIRTLHLFLTTLIDAAGALPPNFVVTLPKVTVPEQVACFTDILAGFEHDLGVAAGALRFEVMIETPQAIVGADGR